MLDSNAATAATRTDHHEEDGPGRTARSARRWFLILAPTLAGLLAIAGAVADPHTGDGAAMYGAYAADPDSLQVKALAYHVSYVLWAAAALLLAGLVRRRGSWIANVAGVLALLGISTMPGFVLADFYDSSIGQAFGVDGALQVEDRMEGHVGADGDGRERCARARARAAGRRGGCVAGRRPPVVGRRGRDGRDRRRLLRPRVPRWLPAAR